MQTFLNKPLTTLAPKEQRTKGQRGGYLRLFQQTLRKH